MTDLRHEMENAERKAWDALARYKFLMFGYWAAKWVDFNRIGGFKEPNPFKELVHIARGPHRLQPLAPGELEQIINRRAP